MFIDSHCHLDFPQFENLPRLIDSCLGVGVTDFLVPGTTEESWHRIIQMAKLHPQIRIALGLHPYFLDDKLSLDSCLEQLECHLMEVPTVAVGEIGLDKWPGMPNYSLQYEVLIEQLKLAKKWKLPVIFHARKSEDDLLKALRIVNFEYGGVVHAFNGSYEQAKRFIDQGFVLGIGGTITYPRAQKARRVLKSLTDQDFVLETDAPDMPLCGHQGQPNSPLRVRDVAQQVSILREQPVGFVAQYTSANLKRVLPNWHRV